MSWGCPYFGNHAFKLLRSERGFDDSKPQEVGIFGIALG